jgi:hypothetical protein
MENRKQKFENGPLSLRTAVCYGAEIPSAGGATQFSPTRKRWVHIPKSTSAVGAVLPGRRRFVVLSEAKALLLLFSPLACPELRRAIRHFPLSVSSVPSVVTLFLLRVLCASALGFSSLFSFLISLFSFQFSFNHSATLTSTLTKFRTPRAGLLSSVATNRNGPDRASSGFPSIVSATITSPG